MSPAATYRFLPWTRRGLAAKIAQPDPLTATLPARGTIRVALSLNRGTPVEGPAVSTYGPGDVIGIDTRVIVRTEPRDLAPDFEPNFLAAVDFDAPDFPWILTPAAPQVAAGAQRLRPWLVLLVLDRDVIEPPRLAPGKPLPSIKIPAAAASTELPDLSESWAWAHVQVAVADGFAGALPAEMSARPDLNVSRLLCPRRLVPEHRYLACLVPAFDLGVRRGLGLDVTPAAPLAPAWGDTAADLELPVYFHWEFSTGPAGDFESLARKLRPLAAPAVLGYERTYLHPEELDLIGLGPDDQRAYTWIEGALRAPTISGAPAPGPGEPGAPTATIPQAIRDRLRERLDEPARIAAGRPARAAQALAPPIYGGWPVNQHQIDQTPFVWLRELNTDPRWRAAAGVGAEVVRKNQEVFMQACWEQVGAVLKANDLLNRARLAQEIGDRIFKRFVRGLPEDRLAEVLSPMHARIRFDNRTVREAVRLSSVPDEAFDPAMRRMVSPQRPWIRNALRRGGVRDPGTAVGITEVLNTRTALSDPTAFVPDGIVGSRAIGSAVDGQGGLDFRRAGLNARLSGAVAAKLVASAHGAAQITAQGYKPLTLKTSLRADGVVLDPHARTALDLANLARTVGKSLQIGDALDEMRTAAAAAPKTASALLLSLEGESRLTVVPLSVDRQGNVVAGSGAGRFTVASVGVSGAGVAGDYGQLLGRIRPGTLSTRRRPGQQPPVVIAADGTPVKRPGAPSPAVVPTVITIMPMRQRDVVGRYLAAFGRYAAIAGVAETPAKTEFVSLELDRVREALLSTADPLRAIPARVRTMVSLNGAALAMPGAGGSVMAPPTLDRVMVGPKLSDAMYSYLADLDGERFVPGVQQLPADSVVLMVTNPRFVEAFMAGLNHEMNRELLWRNYPTDQRGTVFQKFWTRADGGDDIPEIHTWPRQRHLGENAVSTGGSTQVVLLVRGQLLRRYPGTVALAWRGEQRDGRLQLKVNPAAGEVLSPVFSGRFAPDFTFFGFALTPDDVQQQNWFFVLQQQPTEPRFGFDVPEAQSAAPLASWLDATWADIGIAEGAYIQLATSPVQQQSIGGVTFGRDAAHMAAVTMQRPFRAAFDAKKLMGKLRP